MLKDKKGTWIDRCKERRTESIDWKMMYGKKLKSSLSRESQKEGDQGTLNAKIWQLAQSSATKAENFHRDHGESSLIGLERNVLVVFVDIKG